MRRVKFTTEEKKLFSRLGKKGGKSKSPAKIAAVIKNAAVARASRVRRYPPCPGYKNHAHRFNPEGRCYNPGCREKYPDLRRSE